jgi:two-component system response regulator DesR
VIRVAVVQEVPLFRGALAALLHRETDLQVVAEGAAWAEIAPVVRTAPPDVVILDPAPVGGSSPGTADGGVDAVAAAGAVRVEAPAARVLLLLTLLSPELLAGVDLGWLGFIARRASPAHLVSAVRSLAAGATVLDPDLVTAALDRPDNPLTAREQRVLALVAQGRSTGEIARRLALSPGTVRNCLSRINSKTGARNRIQAIDRARAAGWL